MEFPFCGFLATQNSATVVRSTYVLHAIATATPRTRFVDLDVVTMYKSS